MKAKPIEALQLVKCNGRKAELNSISFNYDSQLKRSYGDALPRDPLKEPTPVESFRFAQYKLEANITRYFYVTDALARDEGIDVIEAAEANAKQQIADELYGDVRKRLYALMPHLAQIQQSVKDPNGQVAAENVLKEIDGILDMITA